MTDAEHAVLVSTVVAAFAKARPPLRIAIDESSHPEDREQAELLRGKHWRELQPSEVDEIRPYVLTLRAYRFFLPALLIRNANEPISKGVATLLLVPLNAGWEDFTRRHIGSLCMRERMAVREFIRSGVKDADWEAKAAWEWLWHDPDLVRQVNAPKGQSTFAGDLLDRFEP